jgi:hypothetical protein
MGMWYTITTKSCFAGYQAPGRRSDSKVDDVHAFGFSYEVERSRWEDLRRGAWQIGRKRSDTHVRRGRQAWSVAAREGGGFLGAALRLRRRRG